MKKHSILFGIVLVVFTGLLIRNMYYTSVPFFDWDEGIYAVVAKEMLENGTLSTTFNDEVWLNKPPLSHALIAAAFAIGGYTEFAPRLVMIGFALMLVVLLYFLTRDIIMAHFPKETKQLGDFHRQVVFAIPSLALITTPLYIERALVLNTDTMLGVAWVGYLLFHRQFIGKLIFLCIGVMGKSLVGFYPLLIDLFRIRKSSFTVPNVLKAAALVVIPLMWHIISYLRFGDFFIQAHLFDQIVKRVVAPIELHFGGRLFYPLLTWENLNVLILFLAAAYALLAYSFIKTAVIERFDFLNNPKWWSYLVLFSPIPFFMLLFFSQSKIAWYMATLLPLFCLALSYIYMKAPFAFVRVSMLTAITVLLVIRFVPETFGIYASSEPYTPPERVQIASCIAEQKPERLVFLVDEEERKVRNVLEAAQLYTATSFTYGGSPSFVFYADKDVTYLYKTEELAPELEEASLVGISRGDLETLTEEAATINQGFSVACESDNWIIYTKNN